MNLRIQGAKMKKQIPIGISDFKKIIEGDYYYVDKTLIIKDIAESGEVVLVTRPRRFGKSLNLSMLHYFYEKSEKPTAHLFENLAIWQHSELKQTQGTFPVIFVTFKGVVSSSYEEMLKKFAYVIAREFKRHAYLLTSPVLDEDDRELFKRLRAKNKALDVELSF